MPGRVRDPDRIAWLAGGPPRLADSVVARLMVSGAMTIEDRKGFRIERWQPGSSEVERGVLSLAGSTSWKSIERAVAAREAPIRRDMVAMGLAMDAPSTWQLRCWQTLPYVLLIAFGLIKREVGQIRERPVEHLTALLVMATVLGIARFVIVRRRTKAGDRLLAELTLHSDRLRRAPTGGEVGMAVALFGTAALAGSPWAAFHQLRHPSDSGGSGDGGSDGGCGGGGGGGGGCGGCGG
jgi:uncharacterized protein (TIGR04222 family)